MIVARAVDAFGRLDVAFKNAGVFVGLGPLALGYSAHYTACKHAILGYTRAAAVDYAQHNIRVNAISPGITLTPMMEGFDPAAPENATLMARMPAGRVATPEELVGTVVFMASDMSPYMHGAAISVDGGWTAH